MGSRCLTLGVALCLAAGLAVADAGCGKAARKVRPRARAHEHSEWWCKEHGVPEEVCTLCNTKLAEEAKKKGDWCEEHQRAKSICFKCDPSLREKFAAQYRAKYGKEPPPTEDEDASRGGG
jgi:hypothetical protein